MRLAAAAQQDRVARLHAQAGGVRGDVGARLVDEADDAERHAHARDLESRSAGATPRRSRPPGRAARRSRAGPSPSPRCGASVRVSRSRKARAQLRSPGRARDRRGWPRGWRPVFSSSPRAICASASFFVRVGAERQRTGGRPRRPRLRLDERLHVHVGSPPVPVRGSPGCPGGSLRRSPCSPARCSISRGLGSADLPKLGRVEVHEPPRELRSPVDLRPAPPPRPAAKSPSTSTRPEGSRLLPVSVKAFGPRRRQP